MVVDVNEKIKFAGKFFCEKFQNACFKYKMESLKINAISLKSYLLYANLEFAWFSIIRTKTLLGNLSGRQTAIR